MLLDTGAAVTIFSSDFLNRLYPGQEFPNRGRTVRSLGGNHISVKGPVTLTIEICCRILSHPVYFCDGASTPMLGYDAISAASLVIDTEARQIWSKDFISFEKIVPFTPSRPDTSSAAEPSTFVNSSDILLTITDSSPSTVLSPSVVDLCTAAASATTTVSSSVIDASTATTTASDIVVPSETVRLPARESSGPCDHCSAAPTTSSSTTTDLDDSTCATATVSPASDSVQLDPLAPSFVPASIIVSPSVFISDSVVSNCYDEYELSEGTQLKVPVSSSDTREVELPDHVNDLFLQTVEGLDLPRDTIKGLKQLLYDHRETFASSSADLGFCPLVEHDIDTGDARPIKQSPRRPPLAAREAEDEILDEMLATGVIEPWASPVCLVKKKDGTFGFCIDYRRVNAVSKKDAYPIADIQDALDNLLCHHRFTFRVLAVGNDRSSERAICVLYSPRFVPFYTHAVWLVRCARIILSPDVHSST